MEIYTIGHSNLEFEAFLAALRAHAIAVVVDTRTSPSSRYVPWANRERLAAELKAAGLAYRYAGVELGGKPDDPALRTPDGNPDYDKIARTPACERGIAGLLAAAPIERLALLCSEADPNHCHREKLSGGTLSLSRQALRERLGSEQAYIALGPGRQFDGRNWPLVVGVHVLPDHAVEVDPKRP